MMSDTAWTPHLVSAGQMDSAARAGRSESLYGTEGWGFESLRARSERAHIPPGAFVPISPVAATKVVIPGTIDIRQRDQEQGDEQGNKMQQSDVLM